MATALEGAAWSVVRYGGLGCGAGVFLRRAQRAMTGWCVGEAGGRSRASTALSGRCPGSERGSITASLHGELGRRPVKPIAS